MTHDNLDDNLGLMIKTIFSVHPLINVQHQIVSSRIGATIVLPCDVEASPRSVNYWTMTRGDGEIGNV